MTTQASWKGEMLQAVLGFLPGWIQWTVIGLAVVAFVASRIVKLRRGLAHRRAGRTGEPVPTAGRHGQGRGADYLGAYAPQQTQEPEGQGGREPRGADFLGAYAPQPRQEGTSP